MTTAFSQLRYVQEKLSLASYSDWKEIAKSTKVPFGTVKRIGYKHTKNPRSQVIDKLAMHFRTKEQRGN